ncbi:GNAT family N-acetyltransferase [Kocuria rhizophila]|uniref:GNAT family N-acetyltransferase n=1 Tax=Kocuria rhizophila TaxID=72000 RepID=UPI0011A23C28|nr:GNAT family N-acetyltransferase [Kocuria rhizophila]
MNHQDLSSVRPLSSRDVEALRAATLGNVNWRGERFSREEVLADPAIAHDTVFEPERGDFGFIMVDPSGVVGVAWAQFLGVDNPGYGFVAADVPEASLWVAPECRGAGQGRRLFRMLLVESAARGHDRVSLSVEDGNRARDLYESEGFSAVPEREHDGVMVWKAG